MKAADAEPVRGTPPDQRVDHRAISLYGSPLSRRTWNHDVSQNSEALLGAIPAPSPYRILDLGCGPGRDLVAFRDLGHAVVGLDGCPEFVAMARAVSGCEVWQQDLLAMNLPPASFDGVFANAVLFHLPSLRLARRPRPAARSAEAGRCVLASNPRGQDEEGFVDGRYACFYSFKTWRRLVGDSGFALVDHYFRAPGKPAASNRGSRRSGEVGIAGSAQTWLRV